MTDFTPLEAPAHDVNDLPVMQPGRLVGRDDVLKEIYAYLSKARSVLLHGPPGSGKTALATTLAAAYTQQPGGVLWLRVDQAPLAELVVRVGRAYGQREITSSENPLALVGAAAATLAEHKPLIVLDGDPHPADTAQFLEKCADNLPVMVLSETAIEGPWTPIELERLGDMDAVVLFKQKAGITDNNADIDSYGLTKLLDYRPFPVAIAARGMVASKQTPRPYNEALKQIVQTLGGDALTGAIAASYRALTQPLQALVLMLGATFRGQASAELLGVVSNLPPETLDKSVNSALAPLYLVERYEQYGVPVYRLHPAVYRFAQTMLKNSNRLTTLQEKVHEATLSYAQKYSQPGSIRYERLALEVANFVAAARWAAEQGDRNTANRLLTALTQADDFVSEGGYVYELLTLRAVGSGSTMAFPAYPMDLPDLQDQDDAYDEDEYDEDESEAGFDFATVNFEEEYSEDYDEDDEYDEDEYDEDGEAVSDPALPLPDASLPDLIAQGKPLPTDTASLARIDINQLRNALNQARQQNDLHRQIQILKAIGKVQVGQGKENEAISTYDEALALHDRIDDPVGTLETLDMLSALLAKTGNGNAAILHATRGIKLAQERLQAQPATPEVLETHMHLLTTLGEARQEQGETAEALQAFSQALEIARKSEDAIHEALILYKLGYAYLDNSEAERAIQTWEQARPLFKEQGKRDYEGRVLGGLGAAYSEQEHWGEAIRYLQSALHIAREVGDRHEEGLQLSQLAHALVQANNLGEALIRYRQALHVQYERGVREDIVSAIVDLVRLMMRSPRLLSICEILVEDALERSPEDKEVNQLEEDIADAKQAALARGKQLAPVVGDAPSYAENAYRLLDA